MDKRKDAREVAFQLVFEYLFTNQKNAELFDSLSREQQIVVEKSYIQSVYDGVIENYDTLLNQISSIASNFKLERIFKVDLAILLVSIYEIKFMQDIPYKVSVTQALELAKKYSTEKSSSFINGILSKVEK